MAELKQSTDAKLSTRTHPLYDSNIDDWLFFEESTKGGRQYLEAGHLFSHRLESQSEDFTERKKRAYYLNFCDGVLSTYTNYIMKEKVERPEDSDLDLTRQNANNRGDTIDDFMRKVAFQSGMYGCVHILVNIFEELVNVTKSGSTKVDKKDIFPYFMLITPDKLKDWSFDSNGQLNWVLIEIQEIADSDPTLEREEITAYLLIDRVNWEVQDEDGEKVRSGKNNLGVVPLVTCYHKDIDLDMIGESQIKDIAYINRIIYNWCSCIDEMIERQTFSQLVVPDDGTLAEEEETGDPLRKIGTSSVWTFPSDSAHAPDFISPDTGNLEVIWKMIIAHIREIHRLAGLTGVSEDLYTPQRSGKSQQYGFLNISSTLTAKAANLERAENELNKLAYLWMGKDPKALEKVVYPTSFDVEALEVALQTVFSIVERKFSETLNKELLKKLARKSLPLASEETKRTIVSEIESGDGTIEPIITGGMTQNENSGEVGRPGKSGVDGMDTKDGKEQSRSLSSSTKQSSTTKSK